MQKPFFKIIDKFYGGAVRDDKPNIQGGAVNMEEIDIFSNANYFQAEQIFSADTFPASSEAYARTVGDDDTAYAYGKETAANKVRLFSVASGGGTNPGSFTTLFTSADATNIATVVSDVKFFRSGEASNPTSLYYIQGASTTWYVGRYNIGAAREETWNGSAWVAGTANASSKLTGLNGTNMRPTMQVIFGDLYICNGVFISKVAKDTSATFTEQMFKMPLEWEAVDIIAVGDASIIWARNRAINVNESRGYWWGLSLNATFEDMFSVPMGGPMWIVNIKESVIMMCAINSIAKFFRLSFAAKGAIPLEIPGVLITSVATDASLQPISMKKMVSTKDKFVYFCLNKTDKTGVYVLGQLDADKPYAIFLSKRFATTDYSLHKPWALVIQGPNYFADFQDNGTNKSVRCATLNTPNRSTQAVYQSTWLDMDEPFKNKQLSDVLVATYPLPASTKVATTIAIDYSSTFVGVNKNDGTDMTLTNEVLGNLSGNIATNWKVISIKVSLTSSASNSPKVIAIGAYGTVKDELASK